ncbi:fibrinogen-binding protein-like [Leptopilina heterotoma]|uniref:fibrinogen-binding protein-like n=1 Tax=Leptopilina heterotoma TaxID=63436 RepID=UPI001CA8DCE5|nr:fibrinogen-binding protein-like [Leptopilina heterotoma]
MHPLVVLERMPIANSSRPPHHQQQKNPTKTEEVEEVIAGPSTSFTTNRKRKTDNDTYNDRSKIKMKKNNIIHDSDDSDDANDTVVNNNKIKIPQNDETDVDSDDSYFVTIKDSDTTSDDEPIFKIKKDKNTDSTDDTDTDSTTDNIDTDDEEKYYKRVEKFTSKLVKNVDFYYKKGMRIPLGNFRKILHKKNKRKKQKNLGKSDNPIYQNIFIFTIKKALPNIN